MLMTSFPPRDPNPMAEPGDPPPTDRDLDDEVGFASPDSVRGQPVETPPAEPEPEPEPTAPAGADALPAWAAPRSSSPDPSPLDDTPREDITPAVAIYALIVAAVPTGGVSAVVGLWIAWGRRRGAGGWLASHYIYQFRTLAAAAVAALAGLILIVINLGVFVLFATALWTLARGAYGALRLTRGKPIDKPHSWLF